MAATAEEFFLEYIKINTEGRYELHRWWLVGDPFLPSNYRIAQKMLNSMVMKLKKTQMMLAYGDVFEVACLIKLLNE